MEINDLKTRLGLWPEQIAEFSRQYEVECIAVEKALLASTYEPQNPIESRLYKLAKEYCEKSIEHRNSRLSEHDEFSSAEYDAKLDHIFDCCGLPKDNMCEIEFDVSKPYPTEAFCRDWYLLKFYDLTVEALIELAEALQESFDSDQDDELVTKLVESTERECDESHFLKLFGTSKTETGQKKIDKVIKAFSFSKNPHQRILSVLLVAACLQKKYAFLISKKILNAVLKENSLIPRKTIGDDYKPFWAYCLKSKFLKIVRKGSYKKASLVHFDGDLLTLLDQNLEDIQARITEIVANYDEINPKAKETISNCQMQASTEDLSDLQLVEFALNVRDKWNKKDEQILGSICTKAQASGYLKGGQRDNVIKFLEIHSILKK